ncbi:MAG: glycosyltransferase [Acinetobacter gandensis]|uniref:glycosyltransferase n=1 Tax=Acinetobacter gandensis TaxID=1443941 RepID=UPI003D002611
MKSICLISTNWLEDETAFRNHLLSMVKGFLEKGYFVNLISMDRIEYILIEHENFKHYKVSFHNNKLSSFTKRALVEAKVAFDAINKANQLNCNYNLVMIPSMFLLHFSFLLKNKKNILDVRDLSWEYLSDSSYIKRFAKHMFRTIASLNLNKFLIMNVNSAHEYEYMTNLGFPKQSIMQVQNGVAKNVYIELSKIDNSVDYLKPVISYIGNVGLAQDLTTFIEASKSLPDWEFNIVGHGTDFDRVKKLVGEKKSNLKFWGQVDFVKIKEIYKLSNVLYAQLTPEFCGAMPSKLYEYLVTGRYVIYGGVGEACKNLEKFNNVSIIPPQDVGALVKELEKIKKLDTYNIISHSNKFLIEEEFIREDIIDKFIVFFESKLSY